MALMSAGAYSSVMAPHYNSRPLPAEVLVNGDRFALIRERQQMEDLFRGECDPDWAGNSPIR
jgi:diaminopimelate decarboxylase